MDRRLRTALIIFPIILLVSVSVPPSLQETTPFSDAEDSFIKYYEVDYSITFNVTFHNNEVYQINNLNVWISQIGNWTIEDTEMTFIQRSRIQSLTPAPTSILSDLNNPANQILYFNISIPADSSYVISLKYDILSAEGLWLINPVSISPYNTSSDLYLNYTKAEEFIESDNSLVVSLAQQIAGNVTNPFLVARRFYEWVSTSIQYQIQSEERGAVWAINNRRGDCSEYSDLLIALCRSQGIPARKITGWAFSDLAANFIPGIYNYKDYPAHAWVEIYFEGYGWMVVDPTWANSGFYYFGRIDPFHLITTKGQKTTTSDWSVNEFSFLMYQTTGNPDISDSISIHIEISRVSSFIKSYSLEYTAMFLAVSGLILISIGVISKKTFRKHLEPA